MYTIDYGTGTVNINLYLKNITKGALHSKRSMDNESIHICICIQDSIFCIYCLSRSLITMMLQILRDIGKKISRVRYDAPSFHVYLLIFYDFNICSSRSIALPCIEESHPYFSLPLVAVNTSTTTQLRFLEHCLNFVQIRVIEKCVKIYVMVFRQQFFFF